MQLVYTHYVYDMLPASRTAKKHGDCSAFALCGCASHWMDLRQTRDIVCSTLKQDLTMAYLRQIGDIAHPFDSMNFSALPNLSSLPECHCTSQVTSLYTESSFRRFGAPIRGHCAWYGIRLSWETTCCLLP